MLQWDQNLKSFPQPGVMMILQNLNAESARKLLHFSDFWTDTWNVTVTWNDIFVHSVERDLMILLIWRDTHEHILVSGHINAIFVKNLSLKDVHLKVIVWKFMELRINMTTNKEDLRCMFVKIVDTQPRNQKSTTYTWRKTIHTPQLFWNSTTSDTLNSTIPILLVCYYNVVHKCACWLFQYLTHENQLTSRHRQNARSKFWMIYCVINVISCHWFSMENHVFIRRPLLSS